MSYTISTPSADEMMKTMDSSELRRKELETFQKVVKGDLHRLTALTDISVVCGSGLSECCATIDRAVLRRILNDAVEMIVAGMKVNGKMNNWSNGCFGSRWFDMDAKKYGITYIRGAFYSKKYYKGGEWKNEKPYVIQITAEKEK